MTDYTTSVFQYNQGYQLEKKEIPDDVPWIHSLPSPGDQSSVCNLKAQ